MGGPQSSAFPGYQVCVVCASAPTPCLSSPIAAAEQVWRGFDAKAAFSGWAEYLQFAVPAAIMICLEWW